MGCLLQGHRDAAGAAVERDAARVLSRAGDSAQDRLPRRSEKLFALASDSRQGSVFILAVRPGGLRFLQPLSAGRADDAAAMEAMRATGGSQPGRSPGAGVRGEDLHARNQSARAGDDEADRVSDAERDRGSVVDEPGDEETGAAEAARNH